MTQTNNERGLARQLMAATPFFLLYDYESSKRTNCEFISGDNSRSNVSVFTSTGRNSLTCTFNCQVGVSPRITARGGRLTTSNNIGILGI